MWNKSGIYSAYLRHAKKHTRNAVVVNSPCLLLYLWVWVYLLHGLTHGVNTWFIWQNGGFSVQMSRKQTFKSLTPTNQCRKGKCWKIRFSTCFVRFNRIMGTRVLEFFCNTSFQSSRFIAGVLEKIFNTCWWKNKNKKQSLTVTIQSKKCPQIGFVVPPDVLGPKCCSTM